MIAPLIQFEGLRRLRTSYIEASVVGGQLASLGGVLEAADPRRQPKWRVGESSLPGFSQESRLPATGISGRANLSSAVFVIKILTNGRPS